MEIVYFEVIGVGILIGLSAYGIPYLVNYAVTSIMKL